MIKLIASDIDGTLVPEGAHTISPEYFKVIRDLKSVGIRFCACSGRQYQSMLDLFEPVSDIIHFIAENGTIIRTKDTIIHYWKIEEDLILPIIEEVRRIDGASIGIETLDMSYIDEGEDSDLAFYEDLKNTYGYSKGTDLSDPKTWKSLCDLVDMQSMADYYAAQVYIANADWSDCASGSERSPPHP